MVFSNIMFSLQHPYGLIEEVCKGKGGSNKRKKREQIVCKLLHSIDKPARENVFPKEHERAHCSELIISTLSKGFSMTTPIQSKQLINQVIRQKLAIIKYFLSCSSTRVSFFWVGVGGSCEKNEIKEEYLLTLTSRRLQTPPISSATKGISGIYLTSPSTINL